MDIITKDEFLHNKDLFIRKIEEGAVFIHPTDTIYGIGCDATNSEAVKKVRDAKYRPRTPFSVIAPSKKWIYDNCEVGSEAFKWIEKLPGPYTLILKLRNKSALAEEVKPGVETVGVRIPDNWFAKFVEELGIPVVSTSANIAGDNYMTSVEDLDERLKPKLDFVIYEGEKTGRPSTIVKLYEEKIEIVKR